MCGIFGIVALNFKVGDLIEAEHMSQTLEHRGPDDLGYVRCSIGRDLEPSESKNVWDLVVPKSRSAVILGHRRLSIIDLSDAAHQPMSNETRDVWITYNGEIYNYIELMEDLKRRGHFFRSSSDTEVIVHAYEEWGEDCLQRFVGMWAFAIWDGRERKLFCARDRFGIKPFYFYVQADRFIFASEIKAVLQQEHVERSPSDGAVYDYLMYGYIDHGGKTFFENISQLRGGTCLTLWLEDEIRFRIRKYWDLECRVNVVDRNEPAPEAFLRLFEDSVKIHMRSDVPVGTCLSGGLDSSSIVCLSKRFLESSSYRTFSCCFNDSRCDEREFIQDIVRLVEPRAYYTVPTPQGLAKDLEKLVWFQDEPFGSTSVYAQWSVFRVVKQVGVRVILDGQGADELLGGYHPYFGPFLADLVRRGQFRGFLNEYKFIRTRHGYSNQWLIRHLLHELIPREKLVRVRKFLLRHRLAWVNQEFAEKSFLALFDKFEGRLRNALYNSLTVYSLPGLLHYEDRNSMAHSVEARVPFLDHRLVEFVFSLSDGDIIRDGRTKIVLRQAMAKILPAGICNRDDKIGFATPQTEWMRHGLRELIEDLVSSSSFATRPYFDAKLSRKLVKNFLRGYIECGTEVWRLVNLELWLRTFVDGGRPKK